jgi:hypothetical protein
MAWKGRETVRERADRNGKRKGRHTANNLKEQSRHAPNKGRETVRGRADPRPIKRSYGKVGNSKGQGSNKEVLC